MAACFVKNQLFLPTDMLHHPIHKNTFNECRLLVIGDSMIDRYYHGKITRMSPEADVPVVDVQQSEDKLGGAANVALNAVSLGAQTALLTMVGNDNEAKLMENLLVEHQIQPNFIRDERPTTVKSRIYNELNYVMRLDYEQTHDISDKLSEVLLLKLKQVINEFKPTICILQDYNKGVFTSNNIPQIISMLNDHGVPVAVDPKKKNFFEFKGVDLFKPNAKEVADALKINFDKERKTDLVEISDKLQAKLAYKSLLLTLSEYGVFIADDKNAFSYPAFKRKVVDVSGAGDTVITVAALLLSLGYNLKDIAYYSNLAGGLVIEHKGVSTLSIEEFTKNIEKQ